MKTSALRKETRVLHASSEVQTQLLSHPIASGFSVFFLGCAHHGAGDSTARPSGSKETLFIVTVAGSGRFRVGDSTGVVRNGDILIVPSGIPHAYWCDSDEWSYYWAHVVGGDLPKYILQAGGKFPAVNLPPARLREIVAEFESVIALVAGNRSLEQMILASHSVRNILAMALFSTNAGQMKATRATTHHALEKCFQILLENTRRSLTLRELAAQAGLSPSRLANMFKSQTGTSPIAHHMHLRMQEAAGLLASTDLNIKEVAARMGFQDPYHFSRAFKSHLHTSPMGYRRQLAKTQES
jgi:AraC family transcriptional regulator of arabinose operon